LCNMYNTMPFQEPCAEWITNSMSMTACFVTNAFMSACSLFDI